MFVKSSLKEILMSQEYHILHFQMGIRFGLNQTCMHNVSYLLTFCLSFCGIPLSFKWQYVVTVCRLCKEEIQINFCIAHITYFFILNVYLIVITGGIYTPSKYTKYIISWHYYM